MADFGFQTSQASGTSGIGGSGTTNYVSKFTAASTIGDSQIFDNGSNVGIGSISPNSVLQIKGTGVDLFDVTNNITNLVKVYSDEVTFFDRGLRINKLFQPFSASDITIYSASNAGVGFSLNIGSDFTGANTHYTNIIYTDNASTKRAFTITNTTVSSTGLLELMKDGGNVNIGSTFTNSARVHIQGIDATSSNFALKIDNSASASLLSVRNDGFITINGNTLGAAKLEINGGSYQGIYSNSNVIGLNGTGLANGSIGIACSVQSGFAGTSLYIRSYDVSNKLIDIINSSTNPISRMLDSGYFGIGTISPTAMVHSKGIDATSSNYALKVENSTPTNLLSVRNDGVVDIYGTITPRLQSIVSSATVTPTNLNDEVVITAQATGLTLVNPTGTAVQGQSMIIRIKDNGTARTIAYDTQYRAIGVTLPTTTVINKIVYLGLIYNSTDTKWDVIGVSQEA